MKNISRLNNLQSISHPERKIWRFKKHEKANFWFKKLKIMQFLFYNYHAFYFNFVVCGRTFRAESYQYVGYPKKIY